MRINQYLITFETGEMRIEKADDEPQLLRRLGSNFELSKVICIFYMRKLVFDVKYYEDLSQENDDN